ncbi:MAG: hypothetical protein WAO55_14305 [Candidatus Manganitrophaceae bacterium]
MKKPILLPRLLGGILFPFILAGSNPDGLADSLKNGTASRPIPLMENHPLPVAEKEEKNRDILVEFFLSPERKSDIDAIKKEFETVSITKVRAQVFRKGHPPQNVGFGKEIPADVARLAIRLALTYNDGIQFLLPEKRLAAHYVGIAVSIFDESFQIPVSLEELKRLSDPTLTTDQFHELYRQLTDKPPRINR